MEIVTKGHDAENAVRQIMQLFFSLNDEIKVVSELKEEGGVFYSFCEIEYGDKKAAGEAKCELKEKIFVTNCIKKAVFYAGKKISDMPAPWGISTGIRPAKNIREDLKRKSDESILEGLRSEYLISEEKARLTLAVAKKEKAILASMPENSVSIYVGIPFCPTRCAYCSFISSATEHNNKYINPYVDALLEEIEYTAKIIKALNFKVDTVYFGGGTPTAIEPYLLEKIICRLYDKMDMENVREFTVEAGRPDTFTKEMTDMLKRCNVGRISINPQTMHQKTLDAVGRRHTTEDVAKAFYLARTGGIESINADLIAGLPGEDTQMMRKTVEEILKLEPDAVTVHTLYMKRAADLSGQFDKIRFAENVAEMVNVASEKLCGEGFEPYYMYKQRNTLGNLENVGYAKAGHESLYNVYIMEEVQPILALGAGGSTKMVYKGEIERVFNPKDACDYISRIDTVKERKDEFYKFYLGRK